MTLRRTASGLKSIHIFYRVEHVIFCEGGESLNLEQVKAGGGRSATLDTYFWNTIISAFGNNKIRHFVSVGSKTVLLSILNDVETHSIPTISVCVDRDHSCYAPVDTFTSPYIAVTRGYSWENDVVDFDTVSKLIERFIEAGPKQHQAIAALSEYYFNLGCQLGRWCEVDIALSIKRGVSLFTKSKPMSCLQIGNALPSLKTTYLNDQLLRLGYKRGPKKIVSISKDCVILNTFGKLVSRAIYHACLSILKAAIPQFAINYDPFMRLLIAETATSIRSGRANSLADHYQKYTIAFG